eukprot:c16856_g1_i2.p1 GENE.c16856_g1_i2~~c16856_g1_i2.p1  ORF type:complete len:299 (+),score=64.52 c16856_g1_i2:439-1335(+)
MGGVQRVCGVLGTSLGGALAQYYSFSVAFLAAAGFFALAGLSTIIVPGNSSTQSRTPSKQEAETQQSTASIVRRHWKNLTVGGLFALLLFALRTSSTYVFPLAAANMGLSIADVGYFSACQAAVDTSMFPVAGILVDRSRKLSAIPSVVIIAASYFLVPFCTKSWHLLGANALYGFGNGISSGLLMTIGQDLAPPDCRGKFIGIFRFICESGGLVGPMLMGIVTQSLSLSSASVCIGFFGIFAAILIGVFYDDPKPQIVAADVEMTTAGGQETCKQVAELETQNLLVANDQGSSLEQK